MRRKIQGEKARKSGLDGNSKLRRERPTERSARMSTRPRFSSYKWNWSSSRTGSKATNTLGLLIIFEGRGSPVVGKGGMIKRIMERVSRVSPGGALPSPTEQQEHDSRRSRYIERLPEAMFADLLLKPHNCAGVEYVMGFCTEEEHRVFRDCPDLRTELPDERGIILLKYWLEVSEKEQHKRFLARIEDPSKRWELKSYGLGIAPPLV